VWCWCTGCFTTDLSYIACDLGVILSKKYWYNICPISFLCWAMVILNFAKGK
jgi:hypothetical protein